MPISFHQKPGLVVYLTAGDPSIEATRAIALAAIDAGAAVIELGIPFSDPLGDGPVIQRAMERAVARGTRLSDVLKLAGQIHAERPAAGLVCSRSRGTGALPGIGLCWYQPRITGCGT